MTKNNALNHTTTTDDRQYKALKNQIIDLFYHHSICLLRTQILCANCTTFRVKSSSIVHHKIKIYRAAFQHIFVIYATQ